MNGGGGGGGGGGGPAAGWGGGSGTGGNEAGGSGGGGGPNCPTSFATSLVGPVPGSVTVGDRLDVILRTLPPPPRAVCVDRPAGTVVGAIGGIPGLAVFIDCLAAGVGYEATVDAVAGGRVDVTVRMV